MWRDKANSALEFKTARQERKFSMPGQAASLGNSPDRETEHHNKS